MGIPVPKRQEHPDRPRGVPGALVLGGTHGSLAVARSLGRRGIPVWYITHDHPIAKYSRYVTRSLSWPGPGDAGATRFLLDLADRKSTRLNASHRT